MYVIGGIFQDVWYITRISTCCRILKYNFLTTTWFITKSRIKWWWKSTITRIQKILGHLLSLNHLQNTSETTVKVRILNCISFWVHRKRQFVSKATKTQILYIVKISRSYWQNWFKWGYLFFFPVVLHLAINAVFMLSFLHPFIW